MGYNQSRFHEAVSRGNQSEAYALYFNKKSIREGIQPNSPLQIGPNENSALHYAALFAMKQLYMDLVNKGGKPDMKNKQRRNCLHLLCVYPTNPSVRTDLLRFTLEVGLYGMDLEHVLEERDEEGNTALHLAAAAGLKDCVESLVNSGANLFLTNSKEETAADLATKERHPEIATTLETKMVFNPGDDHTEPVDPDPDLLREIAEAPTGMKYKDIRSMKDQLLIETTQLLGVSLFTAEALLRNHGWSKERLLEAWMADPLECCEKSGVEMPTDLTADNLDQPSVATGPEAMDEGGGPEGVECGICTLPCAAVIQVPCEHTFCGECWKQYLHSKIESGEAHNILCPEYACYKLVPVEVIETVVTREMAQKFLQYDIKAFVESNPHFRWCPHPGCGQAVNVAPFEEATHFSPGAMETRQQILTVHCGNNHYFCWSCGGLPHEPCDCELWRKWLDHIEEMKPKIGDTTAAEADEAASNKWLAIRSKPCPKCKAPIEKTEGCNHMCCRKCKHDFCWVCLDDWKCHNSSTGGYFECNRYDAKKKADHMLTTRRDKVLRGHEEIDKISRFLHYYERYKAHGHSLQLEAPYLDKARHKMEQLYASVQKMDMPKGSISADMSFIEEAVKELLQARRVLKASYAFGYYVTSNTPRRYFENLQGALEEVTEMLAEVVARPHLRKPRAEIIRLTREAREKRIHLCKNVKTLPSPSPQLQRRFNWLRSGDDDDSFESQSDTTSNSVLLQLLDDLRRHQRESQADERSGDIQRALEISRQEYEEERQLNEDIELAKALSVREEERSPNQGGHDTAADTAAATAVEPGLPWLLSRPSLQARAHTLNWLDEMETDEVPALSLSSRIPDEGRHLPHLLHEPLDHTPHHPRTAAFTPLDVDRDPLYFHPRAIDPDCEHTHHHSDDPPQREVNSNYPHVDTFTPFYSNLDRASPSMPLLDSNVEDSVSSPSSNGDPVGCGNGDGDSTGGWRAASVESVESEGEREEGFGPLYGEEEDLRRAIELSLREQPSGHDTAAASEAMMTISGPQLEDSNRLAEQSPLLPELSNLPPELRHLLESSGHRTGARV